MIQTVATEIEMLECNWISYGNMGLKKMQKNLGKDGWRERKTNLGGVPLKFAPMGDSLKVLFVLGKKTNKKEKHDKKKFWPLN